MAVIGFDVILVALASLLIYWIYQNWKINSRLPPIPKGHWLWGNMFDIDKAIEQFRKWQKEYGDIYRLNIGGLKVIMLSGEEQIYEALIKKANSFSGRPEGFRIKAMNNFCDTVSFANNTPHWKNMKKSMMTSLKMYGENLLNLEAVALESIQDCIQNMQNYDNKPFDPKKDIYGLTANIMAQLVCGDKAPKELAVEFQEFVEAAELIFASFGKGKELDIFPFLRHFGNSTWKEIQKWSKVQWRMFYNILQTRKEVLDLQNPRCLTDALFRHQTREKLPDGNPKIDETDIQMIVQEAIAAGMITTVGATHSFLSLMTLYPEKQRKLQQEVDDVIGGRLPRLADRPKMHYMEAAILEVLRYISHVPLLLPHMTTRDATIQGYLIPKGYQIWINVYNLHHDERYWDKPWDFMPERFLNEDGHLVTADHPNRRRLLPFGAGVRVCPGEVLARNRLFLFFASFLQSFTFKVENEKDKPIADPRKRLPGLVTNHPPYKICAEYRK